VSVTKRVQTDSPVALGRVASALCPSCCRWSPFRAIAAPA